MHDRLGFNHRGEVIPTATLLSLLNGASDKLDSEFKSLKEKIFNNDNNEIPVVIMQSKKGIYGIIVDKLMKNIELSIKPVPECLANSNVISGVSILGDGNVVLVLNPDKLV
jgi:two-component system chemotaxis sensor kinase CheA